MLSPAGRFPYRNPRPPLATSGARTPGSATRWLRAAVTAVPETHESARPPKWTGAVGSVVNPRSARNEATA